MKRKMIKPMLCNSIDESRFDEVLNDETRLYEPKIDGIRCIAFLESNTYLQNRYGENITRQFPELQELHKQAKLPCVIDGEIASRDLVFDKIQHRIHKQNSFDIKLAVKQYPIIFLIFDIIRLDGKSVRKIELKTRKFWLKENFENCEVAEVLWHTTNGIVLFNSTKQRGLEGIIAKRKDSIYQDGYRGLDWLKLKHFKEGYYFICGVTKSENGRSFASLLLGEQKDGQVKYVGKVGSFEGLSEAQLEKLYKDLETLRIEKCPFKTRPRINRELLFWTQPKLQVEVSYLEKGKGGKLRHPVFRDFV